MEWIVFSVLTITYLAKIVEAWPKSEPPLRNSGPFRYPQPNRHRYREHDRRNLVEAVQEVMKLSKPDKVNWKKEGF